MNRRTRKIEEAFNLTFDDYYIKQVDKCFDQKPIINESKDEFDSINAFDFDNDLIFGVLDRAAYAKVTDKDNQIPESTKHPDSSTLTQDAVAQNSTFRSSRNSESMPNDQVEGEHLHSTSHVEGEHSFEGGNRRMYDNIEGEQHENEIVEGGA